MEYTDELYAILRQDPTYFACLQKLQQLEPSYNRIFQALNQEDQRILDEYIAICEEIDDIMCATVYHLGKEHGKTQ